MLVAALAAAGCRIPTRHFRPAERSLIETVDGVAGAQYELRDQDGRLGEVRVWCVGAEADDPVDEREPLTYVGIGMEIENTSEKELQFVVSDARLRDIQIAEQTLDSLEPFEPGPTVHVAPDSVATTYLRFELPPGVRPSDVRSFRFRWVLNTSENRSFADFTSFVPGQPLYRGSYNWHWGFGFGYPSWYWGYDCH